MPRSLGRREHGTDPEDQQATVAYALRLFYTSLPPMHRALLDEMAAAEHVSVLQLMSNVWAMKLQHYIRDLGGGIAVEERTVHQKTTSLAAEHAALSKEHDALVAARDHADALAADSEDIARILRAAITEPVTLKDGTVLFPIPTNSVQGEKIPHTPAKRDWHMDTSK